MLRVLQLPTQPGCYSDMHFISVIAPGQTAYLVQEYMNIKVLFRTNSDNNFRLVDEPAGRHSTCAWRRTMATHRQLVTVDIVRSPL